jgi:hypothetical protein
MDNRVTAPGYKHYLEPDTGSRPEVFVTFLNLARVDGEKVNGTLIRVESHNLEGLDDRERNYDRCEITDHIVEPIDGRVWTYIGSTEGRRRYEEGVEAGSAVVDQAYYEAVNSSFRSLGDRDLVEFEETTDAPSVPVVRLKRIDPIPPKAGPPDA